MKRTIGLMLSLALVGCAGGPPPLTPWRADALLVAVPADCAAGGAGAASGDGGGIPGGLSVVRSEGRDVVLVAARNCVWTVDAASGAAAPLPTRGDSIAPTMLDGTSGGLAFSSSLSGSVRAIGPDGAVLFNVSGLQRPLGLRLMPGGMALVAEQATGRILRLGPTPESRGRVMIDGLAGPVGLVVTDATRGYVTEELGGRVTMFRLDRFEKTTVASGLDHPEGLALLPDGRLAVAEVGKRRVLAVDRETGAIEVMVDNLPVGLPSPLGAGDPYVVTDIAAAPGGAIFVSADIDRTVLRLTPRAPSPRKTAP